jgi:hypothetical protein
MDLPIGHRFPYSLKTMNDNTIESIATWHALSRPTPDAAAFNVQLGCHFEEIAEMCAALYSEDPFTDQLVWNAQNVLNNLSDYLKSKQGQVLISDRKEFADAIADQIVTGVGVAHCANMNGVLALRRVDSSNWSKFVNGKPVFDANGKIAKPASYHPANLEGCY